MKSVDEHNKFISLLNKTNSIIDDKNYNELDTKGFTVLNTDEIFWEKNKLDFNLIEREFDYLCSSEGLEGGWENKKKTSRAVSNSHINSIYDDAIKAGALAGKVSGAGGGGFMYFYVPPERRMSVLNAISNYPGFTSNCHFTKRGAYSWRIQ